MSSTGKAEDTEVRTATVLSSGIATKEQLKEYVESLL
jgi:hypothetical protein